MKPLQILKQKKNISKQEKRSNQIDQTFSQFVNPITISGMDLESPGDVCYHSGLRELFALLELLPTSANKYLKIKINMKYLRHEQSSVS